MENLKKINSEELIKELKERGYVRHLWHRDDIIYQAECDEVELTDEEIDEVAELLERKTDANIGINWEVISMWISEVKKDS